VFEHEIRPEGVRRRKEFGARQTSKGVSAAPWGERRVFPHTFIVLSRRGQARIGHEISAIVRGIAAARSRVKDDENVRPSKLEPKGARKPAGPIFSSTILDRAAPDKALAPSSETWSNS